MTYGTDKHETVAAAGQLVPRSVVDQSYEVTTWAAEAMADGARQPTRVRGEETISGSRW
ncbi:MAG TPA: hypothetical protein VIL34_11555 [Actinopolymorphaceae bacterium]